MSFDDIFKVEKEGHIAWLVLNRPQKRNAMGFAFYQGLAKLFADFDRDPDVWVVVIRAEGKSFTAGTDLAELGGACADSSTATRERFRGMILEAQEGINAIERCRKPVIAAIHGHCIGGGVDFVCACDIRIASRDALFSVRETRVAFIADVGTLQRLPHIVGHGWFRELALTGRDFGAEEALKMGFVTRVCEDREAVVAEAAKLAADIAGCAPLAVQGTKEVILYSRDNGVYPGLQFVAQKNAAVVPSEDLFEAVTAFFEKRPPNFKGQ
jgi:enoyl-CoA hydratase